MNRLFLALLWGFLAHNWAFSQPQTAVDSSLSDFSATLLALQVPGTFSFNPPGRLGVLDRTRNANPAWQKKPYIAHVDIRLNSRIFQAHWGSQVEKKWLLTVQLQGGLMLRMFQNDTAQGDESYSVRTPSYLPGFAFFATNRRFFNEKRRWQQYAMLRVWHHSNGQDGYELVDESAVNTYNGDFAERASAELGWGSIRERPKGEAFAPGQKKRPIEARRYARFSRFWTQVGWDWRPRALVNGRFTFYDMYAHQRVHVSGAWADIWRVVASEGCEKKRHHERFRAALDLNWVLDRTWHDGPASDLKRVGHWDAAKRLNLLATLIFRPFRGQSGWGLFAQGGYYGSDPYNIYFQQRLWFYRVGVAAN